MKTEQELQAQIDALAKDIEPQRDLWPELAARIATTAQLPQQQEPQPKRPVAQTVQDKSTGWFWWSGATAAAVLLSVLIWPQGPDGTQLAQQNTAQPVVVLAGSESTDTAVQITKVQWQLTSDFETQRAAMLAQINAVPEFYPDWQQQLAIWQQARQQVLLALSYQPDEPVLLQQLNKLQQQQIHYLQKLVSTGLTYSGVTS
ncbi:hypothetical protein [Rheinheimera sp. 4Y26]|uniref:hypothetical protein n=1 Tax=Rheinheimera sp. 4Y26 TaxID=2977811 RepID=UPI0021B14B07|nr:hypothetical protein [Rheinheimera sp. 4Y26]MCT6699192.1 hypothetical protein [Rheinheimera sp. 4Y26]